MRIISLYIKYLSVRILLILLFIFISFGYFLFQTPQITLHTIFFKNFLFPIINHQSFWMYLVSYLTMVFFVLTIVLLIFTACNILSKRRTKRLHGKYNDLLVDYLFDYLYDEESTDRNKRKKIKRIKNCLKSDVTKRIFLNRLRRVHLQMHGVIRQRNFNLLKSLHYGSFIRAYLHSPYLRQQLFALRIISDFHLQGYEGNIYKLTKNKNSILRSEALVALVKLYIYDDHLFLVDFNHKLSVWDVNMIISTIQQMQNKNINYAKLVKSEIPEIAMVGIILARMDKQHYLKEVIKRTIDSTNYLVAEQSLLTFISFANVQKDYDYLTYKFEIASEKAQIEIIKILTALDDKREKTKFLTWIVENKSIRLKIEAMKILLLIDNTFYTSKFKNTSNNSIKNAFLQIDNINSTL